MKVHTLCTLFLAAVSVLSCSAYAEDQLFYIDGANGAVVSSSLDGTKVTELTTTPSGFGVALDVANKQVYYSDQSSFEIDKVGFSGAGQTAVLSGVTRPQGIAISGSMLYYLQQDTSGFFGIYSSLLDGSGPIELVTTTSTVLPWLAVDASHAKLYWSDTSNSSIMRANLADGTKIETVASGLTDPPQGLAVDEEHNLLYFCNGLSVSSVNTKTLVTSALVTQNDTCEGLAFDNAHNVLYSSSSDGSNGITKIDVATKRLTPMASGIYAYGIAVLAARPATPHTVPDEPSVTVIGTTAKIVLEKFTFGTTNSRRIRLRSGKLQTLAALVASAAKKKEKLAVKYESISQRLTDANGNKVRKALIKRREKRNVITLKKLKPGVYQTKYRVVLTRAKTGKTVGTTKYSAYDIFVVE